MILTRKARVTLNGTQYAIGEPVPVDEWNRLPAAKQHTLLAGGFFTQHETAPKAAPPKAATAKQRRAR